ncbi:adenylyl-sulfate kinase [Campylobacter sp. MIT 21-1685]|uniref:adenylyl-sulfate kinase n=1 Tax=unclassified Campylobacter TaxID=2593542 RepID=UPI00224AC985|nr:MULTISPECIES: adenylyl-sulfate kinase [unclassified Campylobacter]MCX2682295.1 adenylyl-sulfate kinase [Campylobacter sp. MIT 21-1684]MCX2750575.1 adenylyl-sulfate kinase [Campylobacter sp. MIT 21-1682]MCX2806878.1 adenylyl-sulfate kinase [Campylobacter sp. MIT 21-1685]
MDLRKGGVLWLNGLAGSGKSFIAEALYKNLRRKMNTIILLDGDKFRELLENFAYDKESRIEVSLKRSQFAHFLSSQGMLVIVSAISMWNKVYRYNRETLQQYFEIYVKCELDELKRRDKKGLYSGFTNGKISNVVGMDINYDEPKPDLLIDNTKCDLLDEKVQKIVNALKFD